MEHQFINPLSSHHSTFTFMIFKNCSCSYDDTGFAELEINGVNINTTIIKGELLLKNNQVNITLV